MYAMPIARKWAVERIEVEPAISAIQRLHLARLYSIPRWIRPVFTELFQRPVLSLSEEDIQLLTPSVVVILAKSQIKLNDTLRLLAHAPPPVSHSMFCVFEERCEEAWNKMWWMKIARYLLHPTERPQLSKLGDLIRSQSCLQRMHSECKERTLEVLQESDGFLIEAIIVDKAVQSITEIHRNHIVAYYADDEENEDSS